MFAALLTALAFVTPHSGDMFNDGALLDLSQVQDMRMDATGPVGCMLADVDWTAES